MLCLQNKTKQSKAKQTNTTSLPTPQVFRHDKFTDTTISEILQVYRHDKLTDTKFTKQNGKFTDTLSLPKNKNE